MAKNGSDLVDNSSLNDDGEVKPGCSTTKDVEAPMHNLSLNNDGEGDSVEDAPENLNPNPNNDGEGDSVEDAPENLNPNPNSSRRQNEPLQIPGSTSESPVSTPTPQPTPSSDPKISAKEIETKFLITAKHGENGNHWPSGAGATVMACCIKNDGGGIVKKVYRNYAQHAERYLPDYLPEYLKENPNPRNISIDVFINYSPCSVCSRKIGNFVNGSEVIRELNIMFSNLYNIKPYPGNNDAPENQAGLFSLSKVPQVTLSVLTSNGDCWERFLEDFVYPSEDEKNRLQDKANGTGRTDREATDVRYLERILNEEPI